MISLADIEALHEATKLLLAERRKAEKLSERARNADPGPAAQRAGVNLHHQAAYVARLEAVVHARAVDAGLADLREPEHYADRTEHPDAFHVRRWAPAKPRALAAAEGRPC